MIINLVKQHDATRGPESHQVYIFDLTGETPDEAHFASIFEFESEQYRAFASHAQVKPVARDGKHYPVARVKAVKVSDEREWAKAGKHGQIARGVLDGHVAS